MKRYSREQFEGYTHRFKVEFETVEGDNYNMDIYSNSGSFEECVEFIESKKTEKVKSFNIIHQATKEQDELSAQFIEEFFLK